jgi:hypothetical protein
MKKVMFFIGCMSAVLAVAQNVGIGLTNPTRARLEVNGAVDATSAIFGDGTGISLQREWPGIGFNSYWNGGNRYLANGFAAKQFQDPASGYMYLDFFGNGTAGAFAVSTTRALSISPTGNVGLAGAFPNGQLQLSNTLANRKLVLYESGNNNHQYFGLGIESGTMRYAIAGTDNVHRFYAGNGPSASTLLLSIWGNKTVIVGEANGTGRLGINSNFPAYTLDIFQAPGGGGIRLLSPDFHNTNWELKNEVYSNENFTSCLALRYNAGGLKGWFRPTDGGYSANSDLRLKQNIQNMEPVLSRLLQLRPTRYEMKDNNPGKEQSVGFIAQETELLFPEVVDVLPGGPDSQHPRQLTDQYGINYTALSVIAIKAIQEQNLLIADLQKRMLLLEEQNKMLQQLLTKN